jgi:hypothetical protein
VVCARVVVFGGFPLLASVVPDASGGPADGRTTLDVVEIGHGIMIDETSGVIGTFDGVVDTYLWKRP